MSNNPNNDNQQNEQNFSSFSSFSTFGQFGQTGASLNTHWGFAPPAESAATPEPQAEKSPVQESQTATASVSSGFDMFINSPQVESKTAADSDSFLAEPSMTATEFDSTFVKESEESFEVVEAAEAFEAEPVEKAPKQEPVEEAFEQEPEPEVIEPSPEPEVIQPVETADTISMTSPDTIPQIVEEPEKSSPYLESPQSTFIEDATVDASFPAFEEEIPVVNEPVESSEDSAEAKAVVVDEQILQTPKVKTIKSAAQTPKQTPKPKSATQTPKVTKPKSPAKSPAKAQPELAEGTRHSTRQRKSVQRLEPEAVLVKKESTAEIAIPSGSGVRLGDIEVVAKSINSKVAAHPDMVLLHRILFDRMGEATKRKANIRAFCGIDGNASFNTKLQKYALADVKSLAGLLCLPVSGDKSSLIARISSFLAKPSAEATTTKAKPAPTKKAAKVVKAKGTNRSAAVKRSKSDESVKDAKEATKTKASKVTKSSKVTKAKPAKSAKVTKPKATAKSAKKTKSTESPVKSFLTPETVDSDVDSDIEREVLEEIKNAASA